MNDELPSVPPAESPPRRRVRASLVVLGAMLGVAVAVAVGVAVLVLSAGDAPPLLSEERLQQAMERWQQHGPANYDLDVELSGRQTGSIHLEVRHGEPTAMTRNGLVPSRRTWQYWTVPEQFAAIERELTADAPSAFGVPDRTQVILRAEFDEQLGYPRRYQREILGRDESIRWEIVRFHVAP